MDWHGYGAVQNALTTYIEHHGVKGQKWGVRRYQNKDGTLTTEGKEKAYYRQRANRIARTTNAVNSIYKTLSNDQKALFGASPDEIKKQIPYIYDNRQNLNIAKRFIAKDKNGKPASFLDIWDDKNPSVGQIAIATRKDLQGKGYSKEVVNKAINWFNGNQNKKMGELQWNAFERNKASLAIAKRYGFTEQDRLHWEEYKDDDYIFTSIFKKINESL